MNFSDPKTEQNYVLVHIFCVKDQLKDSFILIFISNKKVKNLQTTMLDFTEQNILFITPKYRKNAIWGYN